LGKKSGPTPPPAPDPTVVANAQSAANIATAQEQQRLNMINTAGPQGTVNYAADPNAPGGYSQTTTLSPAEQQTYDLSKLAQNGALGIGNDQLARISQALGQGLDLSGLPALQGGVSTAGLNPGGGIQGSFNTGGPLQYGFDPGQQVQGQVGGDLNQARQQAQDAAYAAATSRLDPQFQRQGDQLDTRLANQGLGQNSAAFQNAQDTFSRGRNDAYSLAQQNAVQQGNTAADQLFQQQLGQGQFANQAAAQMYQQNMGQAGFNNQTAGQDYTQNLGAAQFANQAQAQTFSQSLAAMQAEMQSRQMGNEARNQGMQEQAYVQNMPINQFNSLMSAGQVGMPQGVQYSPTSVGQTDVLGAYALNSQAQQAAYQAQAQQQAGMMGGLFSLGSAAIMASDVRLKQDIERVGTRPDGLGVYEFRYVWGPQRFRGVMAQDVLQVKPEAVYLHPDGFLMVDYGALGDGD
jgi:hypothetical protein